MAAQSCEVGVQAEKMSTESLGHNCLGRVPRLQFKALRWPVIDSVFWVLAYFRKVTKETGNDLETGKGDRQRISVAQFAPFSCIFPILQWEPVRRRCFRRLRSMHLVSVVRVAGRRRTRGVSGPAFRPFLTRVIVVPFEGPNGGFGCAQGLCAVSR